MQDDPKPTEILASVTAFLRDEIAPQLSGAYAFQLRVAINAIELVRREIGISPTDEAPLVDAMKALLGRDLEGDALVAALAQGIADRSIDPAAPDVEAILWMMTEAKLDVDQPRYAGLTRARELRVADGATKE